MKLRELLDKLNQSLESMVGFKFNTSKQYRDKRASTINSVAGNTELGNLIRLDGNEIKLVEEKDINCFGAGEALFTLESNIKQDKRVKYEFKGTVNSLYFIFLNNELPEEILDYELNELPRYFDKLNLENSITWCDEEIEKLKNKIDEIEKQREQYKQELKEKF